MASELYEKRKKFQKYLYEVILKNADKGNVSYKDAKKYFFNAKTDFFANEITKICNNIIYIKLNNPDESTGHILAMTFSKYYGNNKKYLEYLVSLSFPSSLHEKLLYRLKTCKNYKYNNALSFCMIAYEISEYWPLFLSEGEYVYFFVYKLIAGLDYNDFYGNLYSNLYDFETVEREECLSKILGEETGYGNRIYEYLEKRSFLQRKIENRCNILLKKDFIPFDETTNAINEQINKLTVKYFKNLNLYQGNRIY